MINDEWMISDVGKSPINHGKIYEAFHGHGGTVPQNGLFEWNIPWKFGLFFGGLPMFGRPNVRPIDWWSLSGPFTIVHWIMPNSKHPHSGKQSGVDHLQSSGFWVHCYQHRVDKGKITRITRK